MFPFMHEQTKLVLFDKQINYIDGVSHDIHRHINTIAKTRRGREDSRVYNVGRTKLLQRIIYGKIIHMKKDTKWICSNEKWNVTATVDSRSD